MKQHKTQMNLKSLDGKKLITIAGIWLLVSLPTFSYLANSLLDDLESIVLYAILYTLIALGGILFAIGYYKLYSKLLTQLRLGLAILMLAIYSTVGYYFFILVSVLFALLEMN